MTFVCALALWAGAPGASAGTFLPAEDGSAVYDWWSYPASLPVEDTSPGIHALHDGSSRYFCPGLYLFGCTDALVYGTLSGSTLQPGDADRNWASVADLEAGEDSPAAAEEEEGRGSYLEVRARDTPEPASMLLLGLGLGGLALLRRTWGN